ncbi:MAG: (Fe-S)-binding protein [Candidatus Lokiarchaeota archaeon]|nr:(Fe-S)-binding protein [Candidatus Lokiarchaeota archaeon]
MTKLVPIGIEFFAPFKKEACTLCGDCFYRCPVLNLSKDESIKEMKRLLAGEKTKRVLTECQSCFSCNFYCPEEAHPTSLILQRWNDQYKSEGLRKRGTYYMTLHPHYPNFRSHVMEHLPKKTRDLVSSWASLKPLKDDTLTYPGCNIITFAELSQASFFKDLDIRGRLEYCCGETLFRTGYRDELFQVTKRLNKWFETLNPKKLLVLCTAGTAVFKNVLPHYGLTYKFEEIKSYIEYLWDELKNGKIEIKNKLNLSVAIQDSCYSKMFGDDYMDLPRKILDMIGVKVIEIEACRENMRCCGIGAGFSVDSSYQPFKIRSAALRNFKEFRKSKIKTVCVYCAGCLATFTANKKLYAKKIRIYHIVELLQMAIGEKPSFTQKAKKKRAKHFFWGTLRKQVPHIFSKKTFKIAEIAEDPPSYGDAW